MQSEQLVATRPPAGLFYLHGDHLGSVSLVSSAGTPGSLVSAQEFDPWGQVRGTGTITQTSLNYTGQRKDATGLLYYHARYYDPALARFTSADSVVPAAAMGAGGAMGTLGMDDKAALRPLTVDFHEAKFAASLAEEDRFTQQKGFDFQLSKDDKKKAKNGQGPANPQALNRYSYVLNNPLRYTDPTGHYEYTYRWAIGAVGVNGLTAQTAMAYMQQHPNEIFPFFVWGTQGETSIQRGHVYNLVGVRTFLDPFPAPVMVTNISATSFTFTALPGHFDPPGSTVTFTTYERNGIVWLEQHGQTTAPLSGLLEYLAPRLAYYTWEQQARNLHDAFYSPHANPFPLPINNPP